MTNLAGLLRESSRAIISDICDDIVRAGDSRYAALPREELERRIGAGFEMLLRDIEADREPPGAFDGFFAERTSIRVRQGFDIDDVQHLISACERVLTRRFRDQIQSAAQCLDAVERVFKLCEAARAAAFSSAVKAQREMLAEQIAVVQTLSTPVLPLYKGVLVLPLIGSVDTSRASQLLERMLAAIAEHRAAAVIIDVTGVPSIDGDVATHLVRAAQAAGLLGARSIVAGIGAGVAQTMAALGVDFSGVTTCRNLEAALELALGQLDLAILPRPAPRPTPRAGPPRP